jgi:hypothetical protein
MHPHLTKGAQNAKNLQYELFKDVSNLFFKMQKKTRKFKPFGVLLSIDIVDSVKSIPAEMTIRCQTD